MVLVVFYYTTARASKGKALGLEGKGPRPRGKGLLQGINLTSRTDQVVRFVPYECREQDSTNTTATLLTTTTYGL